MARRKSSVQDLPSQYTAEYAKFIQWAEDLGHVARETDTQPDWKKIPDPLRIYTRSAMKGYIARCEMAA
jgi:hypothetical protein